jgi:hypothetical protein
MPYERGNEGKIDRAIISDWCNLPVKAILYTYSAFHSRSQLELLLAPVEIHAFSTWN